MVRIIIFKIPFTIILVLKDSITIFSFNKLKKYIYELSLISISKVLSLILSKKIIICKWNPIFKPLLLWQGYVLLIHLWISTVSCHNPSCFTVNVRFSFSLGKRLCIFKLFIMIFSYFKSWYGFYLSY